MLTHFIFLLFCKQYHRQPRRLNTSAQAAVFVSSPFGVSRRAVIAAMALAVIFTLAAQESPTAASTPTAPPTPHQSKSLNDVDLYVLPSSGMSTAPCSDVTTGEQKNLRDAIKGLLERKLGPTYKIWDNSVFYNIDILASYNTGTSPASVIIATVCKSQAVYTIGLTGYAFPGRAVEKPAASSSNEWVVVGEPAPKASGFDDLSQGPPPQPSSEPPFQQSGQVLRPPDELEGTADVASMTVPQAAITSNTTSGTFDALETMGPTAWKHLFATPSPGPLVSNVAFLPVANDSANINERLLHNVPMTIIATPGPAGPVAPGSSPAPQPPATRVAQCLASADRMLVTGRTVTTGQGNDLTRAIVAGGSLKWSQPGNISAYYISAGVLAGLLYDPASSEVGADVFRCGPNDGLRAVGGLNHHIVGHKTTPAIGTDALAQGRAQDQAIVDLEDQLLCIIHDRVGAMRISDPQLDESWRAITQHDPAFDQWCTRYVTAMPAKDDALVVRPVDMLKLMLPHGTLLLPSPSPEPAASPSAKP